MKVYLCVDMEGHSGIVSWSQVDPKHPHYTEGQELMAGDVNAVVDGAFEGGATEEQISKMLVDNPRRFFEGEELAAIAA